MARNTTPFTRFVDDLNHAYEKLHTAKEDAFWTSYMGLGESPETVRRELCERENDLKRFLCDPERLQRVRKELTRAQEALQTNTVDAPTKDEELALRGWLSTFKAHVIDSADARALAEEIVADEGRLAEARSGMELGYQHPTRGVERASSVKLTVLLNTDPDERIRRSAWEGLRGIEQFVLEHGFLELVRKRNRLGRMLGGDDYYDATVRRVEGMTKAEVFALLDELERETREAARRSLDGLRASRRGISLTSWNLRYWIAGDVTAEQDPFFPFSKALERWGRSFAALGIQFRGAELVLDLVDRPGKYENGFMHGPVPAWRERGAWRPARIQFTANAIPGMVGSGRRATETLLHEGGHAAHFANNDMPAPCFSQEFAPTSVAFSETQSMFCDSLLSDADWQARYARSRDGRTMPIALIEKGILRTQPFAAWSLRAMLAVCYAERAIYEIPERDLSVERVLSEVRDVERRLLFLEDGSPRPALSVPHLLAGESSAYYHGYVLADMAVHQTRQYFLERDGHLVDNAKIGPELREVYWKPGNSVCFRDFIANLTRKALSAAPLASRVNRTPEETVKEAREAIRRLPEIPEHQAEIDLDARIRVVHGRETIASSDGATFERLASAFESWIETQADSHAKRA